MRSFFKHLFFISLVIFLGLSSLQALEDEVRPLSLASSSVLNVSEMMRLSTAKKDPENPLGFFELQNDTILGIGYANRDTIIVARTQHKDMIFAFYSQDDLQTPHYTFSLSNYHSHALHPTEPLLYCAMSGPHDENMDLYRINYREKTCTPLGLGMVFLGERGFSTDGTKLFFTKLKDEKPKDDSSYLVDQQISLTGPHFQPIVPY